MMCKEAALYVAVVDSPDGLFYRCRCEEHGFFGPRIFAEDCEGDADPIGDALTQHELTVFPALK